MLRGLANLREDVTKMEGTLYAQRTITFHRKTSAISDYGGGPSKRRIRYTAAGIPRYSRVKGTTKGLRFLVDTQTLTLIMHGYNRVGFRYMLPK